MQAEPVPNTIEMQHASLDAKSLVTFALHLFRQNLGPITRYVIYAVFLATALLIPAYLLFGVFDGTTDESFDILDTFGGMFLFNIAVYWMIAFAMGHLVLGYLAAEKPTARMKRAFTRKGYFYLILMAALAALWEQYRVEEMGLLYDAVIMGPATLLEMMLAFFLCFSCANGWSEYASGSQHVRLSKQPLSLLLKLAVAGTVLYGLPSLLVLWLMDENTAPLSDFILEPTTEAMIIRPIIDGVIILLLGVGSLILYLGLMASLAAALYLKQPEVSRRMGGIEDVFS